MKLKDIFSDVNTKVFVVSNQEDENELNWTIEATDFELLPEEENIYYVKALQVSVNSSSACYIGIMTPERIPRSVVKMEPNGQIVAVSIYDQEQTVIPAVASDCFGDYELFYAKENPQVGIDILRDGLTKAINKNIVAEDLGYILRDEERFEEAIEAFKISVQEEPSSEYIYLELSRLYRAIRNSENEMKYKQMFKESVGVE